MASKITPSPLGFALELSKLAEDGEKKPGLLRRLLPAALGLAAGAGAYKYLRKVKLSDNPALRKIQQAAKGRLTHIDEMDAGQKTPGIASKLFRRFARGVDDVVDEPARSVSARERLAPDQWKQIKPAAKIEGAVLPLGGASQAVKYKGDLNLSSNPAMVESLENKLNEAKVLRRTPGGAPRSEALSRHVKPGVATPARLDELQVQLAKKYPKGYVVKPVNDAASGGVPTHRDRFAAILGGKKTEHKAWMKDMLKNPDQYMVQEYMDIKKSRRMLSLPPRSGGGGARHLAIGGKVPDEWRVHVANGQVVPGTTMHRWTYDAGMSPASRREIAEVDAFMKRNLAKMPKDVRGVPMAADVARTTDGKLHIIETNAGGQSGFLESPAVRGKGWKYYKGVTGRSSQAESLTKGLGAGAAATIAASRLSGDDKKKQTA